MPQNQVLENRLASARGKQAAVMASQNGVTELRSETLRARLEHADLPTLAGRSTGNRPCSGPQPGIEITAVVVVKTGSGDPALAGRRFSASRCSGVRDNRILSGPRSIVRQLLRSWLHSPELLCQLSYRSTSAPGGTRTRDLSIRSR